MTPGKLHASVPDLFELLVRSVHDYAIFALDPAGHVISWNSGAEQIKGYSAQEILGKHFSIFYPPEKIAEGWPQRELEIATGSGRIEDEGWRVRKDGSRFWASVVITALRSDSGELVGFAKVTRDLTTRRAVEENLRQSEERFRSLVENVRDYAIFMLDPQGFVLTWNRGAERIKGYAASEIIGEHFSRFYPPQAIQERWPWRELEIAQQQGRFEDEGWRVRKDGSLFWANVVITALYDSHGGLYGFSKITRDISERRKSDEAIRVLNQELRAHVDQLAESNRQLAEQTSENETFVYSVSHDIRAPLVNLQGFSQEMCVAADDLRSTLDSADVPPGVRARALRLLDSELSESIRYVQSAVVHLANIIDALLRLSRVGRVVYQPRRVDVNGMVSRILETLTLTIESKRGRVRAGRLPAAWGDPGALEQLFSNLISNAIKYADPGRLLEIEIGALPEENGMQTYFIKDNGLGIPEAAQKQLFSAFRRFHPYAAAGEGMGLAIVRRIAERHRGAVAVHSNSSGGSIFSVSLPIAPEKQS